MSGAKKNLNDHSSKEVQQLRDLAPYLQPDKCDDQHCMKLSNEKKEIFIRTVNQEDLIGIKNALDEYQKTTANLGRPLAYVVHTKKSQSLLAHSSKDVNFRGLMNVLVILLVATNIRHIIASYQKYSFLIFDTMLRQEVRDQLKDPREYVTMVGLFGLSFFVMITFITEKYLAPSSRFPRKLLFAIIVINITMHLIYPIYFIEKYKSHKFLAVYFMMISSCSVMKIISFHHVLHDVRRQRRLILKYHPEEGSDSPHSRKKKYMLDLPIDLQNNVHDYP